MTIDSFVTVEEAATETGYHKSHIRLLCRTGRIEGATKVGRDWMVPMPLDLRVVPIGFVTMADAARELGISRHRVKQLCEAGSLVGARKVGKRWEIPSPVHRVQRRVGRPPRPEDEEGPESTHTGPTPESV